MDHNPNDEKLERLAADIQQAHEVTASKQVASDVPKGSNIGYDFIGAVLGCTFLGWVADKVLGIQPWGIVVMLMIGFAVGVMNAWRALSKQKPD